MVSCQPLPRSAGSRNCLTACWKRKFCPSIRRIEHSPSSTPCRAPVPGTSRKQRSVPYRFHIHPRRAGRNLPVLRCIPRTSYSTLPDARRWTGSSSYRSAPPSVRYAALYDTVRCSLQRNLPQSCRVSCNLLPDTQNPSERLAHPLLATSTSPYSPFPLQD